MVLLRNQEPLCNRKTLYIGSAVPTVSGKGVEAVQQPLLERYHGDLTQVEGIDCDLAVWPDCLEMTYMSTGQIVQFPLRNLIMCAAVRCINAVNGATGEINKQFVPVNIVASDRDHPAIFTTVIRRSQGRQILECHSFICKSNRDALLLVSATGTANLALKGKSGESQYEDGIEVVHMTQQNGYSSAEETKIVEGHLNRYGTEYQEPQDQTLLVKTGIQSAEQPALTAISQGATSVKEEDNTIYISFDKTNLTRKGASSMTVDTGSREYAGEGKVIHASDRSVIVEKPVYVDVPAPVPTPRPYVVEAPKYYLRQSRPVSVPVPPVVYQRPVPVPQPAPVLVPVPAPVAYRVPPPPPPVQPVIVRTQMQPVPQRIYTRRVVPQHQRRYLSPQPPVVIRQPYSRSRSASPGYARSEIRVRNDYRPKVTGHHSDPGIGEFSHFVQQPRTYGQPMFLNERAFSKRMNADQRISGMAVPYNHPSAYDFQDAMGLEQVTYKSNPKYSSSSSSNGDKERDRRFSKRRSRRN